MTQDNKDLIYFEKLYIYIYFLTSKDLEYVGSEEKEEG